MFTLFRMVDRFLLLIHLVRYRLTLYKFERLGVEFLLITGYDYQVMTFCRK